MNRRLEELERARARLVMLTRAAGEIHEDSTATEAWQSTDPSVTLLERATSALARVITEHEKEKQRTEGGPRL